MKTAAPTVYKQEKPFASAFRGAHATRVWRSATRRPDRPSGSKHVNGGSPFTARGSRALPDDGRARWLCARCGLALCLLLLAAAPVAWAQEAAPSPVMPPLPQGPLLKRAPDFSQWVITCDSPAEKTAGREPAPGKVEAAKPKAHKEVQVTKAGPIRRVVTVEPDGSRSEVWCKGSVQALVRPEWKYPVLADKTDRDAPENQWRLDYSKTDFPGCEWVSATNYKGIQKLDGRDCIVFQDQMVAATEDAATHPASSEEKASGGNQFALSAYIDMETRLPVRVISGGEVANYKFGPAPQAMLEIPANIREAIEARDTTIKKATSMPPTPFGVPAPTPPPGALLKRAPDFSQWVVIYSNPPPPPKKEGGTSGKGASASAGDAAKPILIKRVEITKTGPVRCLVTVDSDGHRSEVWCNKELQITCMSGWNYPWITGVNDSRNPFRVDFSRSDFNECEWISASTFKGIQKFQGKDCLVFGQSADSDPTHFTTAAYIDLETRLPVMAVAGGEIVSYQFGPPPQAMLEFPANIRAAIQAQAKEIKHLTSMPPRPY